MELAFVYSIGENASFTKVLFYNLIAIPLLAQKNSEKPENAKEWQRRAGVKFVDHAENSELSRLG